jgi:hypothetical protein
MHFCQLRNEKAVKKNAKTKRKENGEGIEIFLSVKRFQQAEQMIEAPSE